MRLQDGEKQNAADESVLNMEGVYIILINFVRARRVFHVFGMVIIIYVLRKLKIQ